MYVNGGYGKPRENPVFVAACELQHKIAHIVYPDLDIPLEGYLNLGD
jgi:hypothetical protein